MLTQKALLDSLATLCKKGLLPDLLVAANVPINDLMTLKTVGTNTVTIDLRDYQSSKKKAQEAFKDFIGNVDDSKLLKKIKKAFSHNDDSTDTPPARGWVGWRRVKSDKSDKKKKLNFKALKIARWELCPADKLFDSGEVDADTCLFIIFTDMSDDRGDD